MYNYDVLAITYDIWISGTKIDMTKKACINSIDIEETVEKADSATIKISDPEFLYIEDNIFKEDNQIKISLGWDNTTYRVEFNGYISAIDIDFNNMGIPQITITCMDNTHKMNREKKNNTYTNTTSAEVVKKIVKDYGFNCVIDTSYSFEVQETITQSNQTDIDFISNLASNEVHPFTARLVGNTFYYTKIGTLTTPVMELSYRNYPHDIISFSPKLNKETKKVKINKGSVNTSDKSHTYTGGSASGNSNEGSANDGNNPPTNDSGNSNSGSSYTYDPVTRTWIRK